MPWHIVKQGEWIEKIAAQYGIHDWKKIYDDNQNVELKKKRPDPNILYPDDRLFIPELEVKEVSISTNKSHRFVVKKRKTNKLSIMLKDEHDQPLSSKPYKVIIDGITYQGTTQNDGMLEIDIPVTVESSTLHIDGHEIPIRLGHLDPIDEISGVQARLHNLGYDCGEIDGDNDQEFSDVIKQFQQDHGLEVTGSLNDKTKDKLKEVYGC